MPRRDARGEYRMWTLLVALPEAYLHRVQQDGAAEMGGNPSSQIRNLDGLGVIQGCFINILFEIAFPQKQKPISKPEFTFQNQSHNLNRITGPH